MSDDLLDDTPDTQDVEIYTAESAETQNEDGTTTILLADDLPPVRKPSEWFENLCLTMDETKLNDLAVKYLNLIEADSDARQERDKMQASAMKKAGLGDPAPGGADFEGASRVTHPILIESYIEFSANAIKELFPSDGPVRSKIEGESDKLKLDRAKRKTAFMNWQCTQEIRSYRPELERLLTQLPPGGSQYMKLYWNDDTDLPEVEFVPIDDMVLPYEARTFYNLQRKFHRMLMTDFDYSKRVNGGLYVDDSLPTSYVGIEEDTASARQIAKIEGKRDESGATDNNGERLIYEGCVYETNLEDDDWLSESRTVIEGKSLPYLITIDEQARKVIGLYRNWSEEDKRCQEIDFLVDWTFIPWRGVFGLSLPQCLAGLPDALTGALRALLDSALISNMQGGLKLESAGGSGASLSIAPTQITTIPSTTADDIRKVYMPIPFNPPSPMLFQLLGFLKDEAKNVVGIAQELSSEGSANMPVGTTLALIEQGSKVFSSIHARLHDSQRRCLEILHRLNKDHLPDGKVFFGTGEDDYVTRADFEGPMDVHPVSDPNIFSEAQRFAQIQFVMQSVKNAAQTMPQVLQIFNMHALYARMFDMAKIPAYNEFLIKPDEAEPLNPADENINMVMGKPVKAYEGQNHEAHIQVLLDFAQQPLFGANPIVQQKFLPSAMNHLMDHLLVWYGEMMKATATHGDKKVDFDMNPDAAIMMAKRSPIVDQAAKIAFAKIPDLVAKGVQQLKAMSPQGAPPDPMVAVAQQQMQGQQQIAQGKLSLEQQQVQVDAQAKAQQATTDYHLEMQKIDVEVKANQLKAQTDLAKTVHNNQTAENIAAMKIHADAHTQLTDGGGLTHVSG